MENVLIENTVARARFGSYVAGFPGNPVRNLTIRNLPTTVAELRKRLKVKEGGDVYLFATTLSDGSHALLRCRK